jgi:hypothetical protein
MGELASRRSGLSDGQQVGDVHTLMRIWQGMTPDGYALLVERDSGGRWVVTVASVSQSRNDSLEAALLEAGGGSVPRSWAARLAAAIARPQSVASNIDRTQSAQAASRVRR